jgi:hypothetical protein
MVGSTGQGTVTRVDHHVDTHCYILNRALDIGYWLLAIGYAVAVPVV